MGERGLWDPGAAITHAPAPSSLDESQTDSHNRQPQDTRTANDTLTDRQTGATDRPKLSQSINQNYDHSPPSLSLFNLIFLYNYIILLYVFLSLFLSFHVAISFAILVSHTSHINSFYAVIEI